MSCTTCEKPETTNKITTKNESCPYRMSDGRNFTDYRTRCTVDYQKKTKNLFKSNFEERQFLIHNAGRLMKEHEADAQTHNMTHCCFKSSDKGTMLPEKNMVQCNKKTCQFYENDYQGIGTGRNYASF
jgi:hypothetical protein